MHAGGFACFSPPLPVRSFLRMSLGWGSTDVMYWNRNPFFLVPALTFNEEDIPVSASFQRERQDGFSGVLAGVLPSGVFEVRWCLESPNHTSQDSGETQDSLFMVGMRSCWMSPRGFRKVAYTGTGRCGSGWRLYANSFSCKLHHACQIRGGRWWSEIFRMEHGAHSEWVGSADGYARKANVSL